MVHDPRRNDKQIGKAGSLLFFAVAILVMVIAAALELLQRLPPLQIGSHALFLLLFAALAILAHRIRGKLR